MEMHGTALRRIVGFAGEVVAETLWPTRCVLCDRPGDVLCPRCAYSLPFLDWWRACRRCGAPYGFVQCDTCNPVSLGKAGVAEFPFDRCTSAVMFTGDTGHMVRVYKDLGEQRLAPVMAGLMVRALPPGWRFDAVTFVPATTRAYKRRGFDHAKLLAQNVAAAMAVECVCAFKRPDTRDQRGLGKEGRLQNSAASLEVGAGFRDGASILLVDDVYTTGATLCAASSTLKDAGASTVSCLTFARV